MSGLVSNGDPIDAPAVDILHALRLLALADESRIVEVSGWDAVAVTSWLDDAETRGLVRQRHGVLTGWALTTRGRAEGEAHVRADTVRRGAETVIAAAYQRFLVLNPEILDVCSRWQVRVGTDGEMVNDHRDPVWDGQVLADLDRVHGVAMDVVEAMATHLVRFSRYRERLVHARDRVLAGDGDWLCRASIDSYHTVWFEWHEDILATLGRSRNDEASDRGVASKRSQ